MKDIKVFNVRLPRDEWLFIKQKAMESDISMNELIRVLIERYRKKSFKKVDAM